MEAHGSCCFQVFGQTSWLNEVEIEKNVLQMTICGLMSKCTTLKAAGLQSCLQMKIASSV